MNQVVLIGRITKDPELRFTAGSGKAICNFNLAVDRPFAKEKTADFFRIVVFGKTGENCANYLVKGSLIGVQGRIQNNNYETSTGEKRYTTDIIADRVEFLDNKKKNQNNDGGFDPMSQGSPDGFNAMDDSDDDIPF